MKENPRISIIITTYNGESVIGETLESIFSQTYQDYEIIIVDDCSKDSTVEKIKSYNDARITLLVNESNQGSFFGLTRALKHARGEFIARTDQDDISYPNRLKKQLEFMDGHPDIFLCGTRNDYYFGRNKRKKMKTGKLNSSELLAFSLLFGNYAFIHSSFFFRREEAEKKGIKYEKYPYSEDYHFLLQAIARAKIGILDEVLVGYRIHPGQFTNREPKEDMYLEDDEIIESYSKETGISSDFCSLAKKINRGELKTKNDFKKMAELVCDRAKSYGLNINIKNEKSGIGHVFTTSYIKQKEKHRWMLKDLFSSSLFKVDELFCIEGFIFLLKCFFTR